MKRYFSPEKIDRVSKDFNFLVKKIRDSYGEFDLRLREGYFNLYYKGNSLAKVTVNKVGYVVSIHKKFATDDVFRGDDRFLGRGTQRDSYLEFRLRSELLHPFFQKKHLDRLCANITKVNYSEEITFEQMLITDNLDREDFLIIDRQVTETSMKGKKIDLLGLRQQKSNQFQFTVIEVKLGKNPELRSDVVNQLNGYLEHIREHIQDWRKAYQVTYSQMKQLDLFKYPKYDEIEIISAVRGLIAVGWYSGIAKESIKELKPQLGDLEVRLFTNTL